MKNDAISGLSWRLLPLRKFSCFENILILFLQQFSAEHYSKQMLVTTYWGKHTFSVLLVISVLIVRSYTSNICTIFKDLVNLATFSKAFRFLISQGPDLSFQKYQSQKLRERMYYAQSNETSQWAERSL